MKPLPFIRLISLFFLACPGSLAQTQDKTTVGPEKGTLYIVGGGRLPDDIYLRFIELAGGNEASIVVIPTARGEVKYGPDSGAVFTNLGAKNVTILHSYDRKEANTEAFCKCLATANAVWFHGGRQWRLVDAYKNTLTEKMFWNVLSRGGVIGGSSAGATIQGSYLARGDTENNQVMMGDHEEGFGFMKNTAIDQHVLARNRHFDLFSILRSKPGLLGIGIDENTAIEVTGDQFLVSGNSYAVVYDGSFWSREGSSLKKLPETENLFYFLKAGDRYDLKNRKVIESKE